MKLHVEEVKRDLRDRCTSTSVRYLREDWLEQHALLDTIREAAAAVVKLYEAAFVIDLDCELSSRVRALRIAVENKAQRRKEPSDE